MNFTRPAAEVEVVTSMANRYDIMFGKKVRKQREGEYIGC